MEKILNLLDTNARLTQAEMAAMLDKTEEEVASEMARLEKDGVIRGYKAVIDWERTDRKYVTAMIELKVSPCRDSGFDGLAEKIMAFEEVESLYLMSGGFDLMVIVNGCSFKDVAMFVARRLSTLESVLSTATHFVLRRYKDRDILFLHDEQDERGAI